MIHILIGSFYRSSSFHFYHSLSWRVHRNYKLPLETSAINFPAVKNRHRKTVSKKSQGPYDPYTDWQFYIEVFLFTVDPGACIRIIASAVHYLPPSSPPGNGQSHTTI